MAAVVLDDEVVLEAPPPPRWLMVVTGVLWLVVALVVLSFTSSSAATIGYMMAAVLVLAAVDEIVIMTVAPGWRWLHAVAGALFLVTGLLALVAPFQTFGILAMFIGWYLLIKGFFDIALAIGLRHGLPLWGLALAVGIGEVLLGLWALGYPGRSAWLLILWVGVGASLRGVGDLVSAFTHGGAR